MLSREENELLTRTGPGTAMGEAMRLYWIPALLAREIAGPDGPPVRVRLLGEDLVAFRQLQDHRKNNPTCSRARHNDQRSGPYRHGHRSNSPSGPLRIPV